MNLSLVIEKKMYENKAKATCKKYIKMIIVVVPNPVAAFLSLNDIDSICLRINGISFSLN